MLLVFLFILFLKNIRFQKTTFYRRLKKSGIPKRDNNRFDALSFLSCLRFHHLDPTLSLAFLWPSFGLKAIHPTFTILRLQVAFQDQRHAA